MRLNRAVFLDFDGTIGDQGENGIRDFVLYPFASDAIRLLNNVGLLVIIVTNQSRIALGEFTDSDFVQFMEDLRHDLASMDARIDAVYYCPHAPADRCTCRKPLPGMLRQARRDFHLDLTECYMVGDVGAWDMMLARSVGCKAILVRTGAGKSSLGAYRNLWAGIEPDFVAEDVFEAARWIAAIETNAKTLTSGH